MFKNEEDPAIFRGHPRPGTLTVTLRPFLSRTALRTLLALPLALLPLLQGCGSGQTKAEEATADSVTRQILTSIAQEESTGSTPLLPNAPQAQQPLDIATMGYNRGDPEAPLKVLEISDFGCGYCRRFHEEIFPVLNEAYVKPGLVEWKFLPFVLGMFPHGLEAALASECGGEQDHFFPMQSRLFADQSEWKNADEPNPIFLRYAQEEGLDVERFSQCLEDGWRNETVRANIRLGREIGVRGTPTFLVGGVPVSGALPVDTFRDILDVALTHLGITPPAR